MKYMGNKASLLRGTLGEILETEILDRARFVDLFSGSGSVSHFIAERHEVPVLSVDLQLYAKVLAGAITERSEPLQSSEFIDGWVGETRSALRADEHYGALSSLERPTSRGVVDEARARSAQSPPEAFITKAYGGHYFAPHQAYALDKLYESLPVSRDARLVGLAAILHAASACSASPGHTAQPFQPTQQLLPHIAASWGKDAIDEVARYVRALSSRSAKVVGEAVAADALSVIPQINDEDLVFCDPPYSAVQYSRFYHVLEGIATGGWSGVSGAGRSPERGFRSSSSFSMKSQAKDAMGALLFELHKRKCRVVITFPDASASNGLSGAEIAESAKSSWNVEVNYAEAVHSTLGGHSRTGGRGSRRAVKEVVLVLRPR